LKFIALQTLRDNIEVLYHPIKGLQSLTFVQLIDPGWTSADFHCFDFSFDRLAAK
jgi:hypothetical protein